MLHLRNHRLPIVLDRVRALLRNKPIKPHRYPSYRLRLGEEDKEHITDSQPLDCPATALIEIHWLSILDVFKMQWREMWGGGGAGGMRYLPCFSGVLQG